MLFKILHGAESRISTDVTPFHEGYCYVTHEGNMYVDMNVGTETAPNNQRVQISSKDALTSIEAQALINQNSGEKVYLWVGTQAELDAIEERDENCVYFTTDEIDFDPNDVLLVTEQTLTEEQKAQARANIGVLSSDDYWYHNMITEGKGLSISYYDYSIKEQLGDQIAFANQVLINISDSVVSTNELIKYADMFGEDHLIVVEITDTNKKTIEMISTSTVEIFDGFVGFIVDYDNNEGAAFILSVPEDNYSINGTTFPKKGIYVTCNLSKYISGIYIVGHDFRNLIPNDFWTTKPIFYSDTFAWDGDITGLTCYNGIYKMATKHTLSIDNFPTNIKLTVYTKMTINGETQESITDVDISMFEQTTGENADMGGKYILFSHTTVSGLWIVFMEDGSIYASIASGFHVCKINMPDVSDAFYVSTEQPVVNQSYMNITIGTQDLEDGVSNLPNGAIYLVVEQ